MTEIAAMSGHEVPAPGGPNSPRRSLWTAIKRSVLEFDRDNAWDWAAALTYYGVLSIFPGLLVLVSVIGLFRREAVQPLVASLSEVAPGPVRSIINEAVAGLLDSPRQAGIMAVVGLVVGVWSASGYAGAFMRAANAMYDVPEGRPIWKTTPIRLGMTLATGVLLVASAVIVVVSGNLASALGRALGLEATTVTIWNIVKWPVLVVLVTLMFAVLYWASPNARQGGFPWVSPGGLVAVVLWLVASALFGVYAVNFASYDKTYGTLAGVAVFLTWLWISNLALLLGLEVDAELERQRAIAAGLRPDAEPYLRLRDDRAVDAYAATGLADRASAAPTSLASPSTVDAVTTTDTNPRPPSARPGPASTGSPGARAMGDSAGRVSDAMLGFVAGIALAWLFLGNRRDRRQR
jgi:membrane protein